ncbi:unnamed protein product [Staurois parvus]|uniref:Uncharacterized protein n=1 Tax=Staurois parvus TaxID=386267 RepID=A0ABN9EXD9_9NEOB|nr:unnamed protein product [Staurois parvus]
MGGGNEWIQCNKCIYYIQYDRQLNAPSRGGLTTHGAPGQ